MGAAVSAGSGVALWGGFPGAALSASAADHAGVQGAWAHGDLEFTQGGWARWLKYEMAHKRNFHFVDSPVAGLIVASPTEYVYTDESGAAPYFPGESASFYLG